VKPIYYIYICAKFRQKIPQVNGLYVKFNTKGTNVSKINDCAYFLLTNTRALIGLGLNEKKSA